MSHYLAYWNQFEGRWMTKTNVFQAVTSSMLCNLVQSESGIAAIILCGIFLPMVANGVYYRKSFLSRDDKNSETFFNTVSKFFILSLGGVAAVMGAVESSHYLVSESLYPRVATGIFVGVLASIGARLISNTIKFGVEACHSGHHLVARSEKIDWNIFKNSNISATICSAACYSQAHHAHLTTLVCGLICSGIALGHLAFVTAYQWWMDRMEFDDEKKKLSGYSFSLDLITLSAAALTPLVMPYIVTSATVMLGVLPMIASTAVIGVGAAASIHLLSTCASALFAYCNEPPSLSRYRISLPGAGERLVEYEQPPSADSSPATPSPMPLLPRTAGSSRSA